MTDGSSEVGVSDAEELDAALEHFRNGGLLRSGKVLLRLASEPIAHVVCLIESSVPLGEVSEETVRRDLEAARDVLAELRKLSPGFAGLADLPESIAVTEDDGRYYIALLTEAGIKWV